MTELDQVISKAYESQGKQDDVNKVYLTFIRTNLFLPVEKELGAVTDQEEPFRPLYTEADGNFFMIAFDTEERLRVWAADQIDNMAYVEISGKDLVAGASDNVHLCINYGTEFYKEFSPDEVRRLKMIVNRIEQMKGG